jgi:LVIVD repeat-containing protein
MKTQRAPVATSLVSLALLAATTIVLLPAPGRALDLGLPPLAVSSNVEVLGNVPTGPALGMSFKDHWAFVTGPTGLTVLDIADPAAPQIVAVHPLPHFENEDVDLCGNLLTIVNDRGTRDIGAVLYVFDISVPTSPVLASATPVGLTGTGRGAGHIATFVKSDCSLAWLDGGDLVEVFDMTNAAAPRSLGKFESVASLSANFKVTHETSRDTSKGLLWSVGGGGAAAYRLGRDPLQPRLIASTSPQGVNPSPYNDFILHNSQRSGQVLLVTEEDYVDTDETPPGGCRGQGKFETWSLANFTPGGITPLDTWMTELNASDSKAAATVNCSSHWFEEWRGLAAVGWYEQGTRFLDVHNPSDIRQVGYYLPANGSTWAAYWSPTDPTRSIVYTADAYRGVDVLRIDRRADAELSTMPTVTAPVPAEWFASVPAYRASETWVFACPLVDVTVG